MGALSLESYGYGRRLDSMARIVVRMAAVPDSPTWMPETRYARNGDVHIAYQVFGEGELTFVGLPGIVSNIEVVWEDPEARR